MTSVLLIVGSVVLYCVVTYAIASTPSAARPRRRVRRGYESAREIADAPNKDGEVDRYSALSVLAAVVTAILEALDDD